MQEPSFKFTHEHITNYNLSIVNVKIYSEPSYESVDPAGNMVSFQKIDAIMSQFVNITDPSAIPAIIERLSAIKEIIKVEVINPTNLNGYAIYFRK